MKISKLMVFLMSMVLLGSMLYAKGMSPMSFKSLDADKNGYITQKEFDSAKEARMMKNANEGKMLRNAGDSLQYSTVDTDNDGKVTELELLKGQQLHMQEKRQNRMNNRKGKGRNSN